MHRRFDLKLNQRNVHRWAAECASPGGNQTECASSGGGNVGMCIAGMTECASSRGRWNVHLRGRRNVHRLLNLYPWEHRSILSCMAIVISASSVPNPLGTIQIGIIATMHHH